MCVVADAEFVLVTVVGTASFGIGSSVLNRHDWTRQDVFNDNSTQSVRVVRETSFFHSTAVLFAK